MRGGGLRPPMGAYLTCAAHINSFDSCSSASVLESHRSFHVYDVQLCVLLINVDSLVPFVLPQAFAKAMTHKPLLQKSALSLCSTLQTSLLLTLMCHTCSTIHPVVSPRKSTHHPLPLWFAAELDGQAKDANTLVLAEGPVLGGGAFSRVSIVAGQLLLSVHHSFNSPQCTPVCVHMRARVCVRVWCVCVIHNHLCSKSLCPLR